MITLTYTGVNGSHWELVGPEQGREGVVAAKLDGFVADPEVAYEPTPAQTGEDAAGWVLGSMTGSLDLNVSPLFMATGGDLHRLFDRLGRAWSKLADGDLTWRSDAGVLMRTRARLDDKFPMPDKSPAGLGERLLRMAVPVRCLDGVWLGPTSSHSGAGPVANLGDLDGYPRVEWSGSGAQVSGPGIPAFTLPTTAQPAVWDTDPSTGGLVTIGGQPATALRRQLRGRVAPAPIVPGGSSSWTFTGCVGVMQPKILNPWGR